MVIFFVYYKAEVISNPINGKAQFSNKYRNMKKTHFTIILDSDPKKASNWDGDEKLKYYSIQYKSQQMTTDWYQGLICIVDGYPQ